MEKLLQITEDISGIVWGWPMIILLLGTHIFLTFRLKFPQRKIVTAKTMPRIILTKYIIFETFFIIINSFFLFIL